MQSVLRRLVPLPDTVNPAWVLAAIEAQRTALLSLTAALVAAPSANPPGDTTAPARVLAEFLSRAGIETTTLAEVPHKPNIVATVTGALQDLAPGPGASQHVVLCGHLDTILPGEAADWTVDPGRLTTRGPDLIGLGVGNMKAGLAALAVALACLHDCRAKWAGRVTLAAVADETVFGPHGAEWLLATYPDLRGDVLICGEGPGGMALAVAEKGVLWISVQAAAPSGQGMLTTAGSSATARLAKALVALDGLNAVTATPPEGMACLILNAGAHGLRLSVNIGTLQGGGFISQRPGVASAEIDVRVPPGLALAAVEAKVHAACAAIPGVSWSRIKGWEPNWSAPDSRAAAAVSRAAAHLRGAPPDLVVRLPGSDAARWRALGVPAVCYGPQMAAASGPDDAVRAEDVVDCAKVYTLAALDCLR